LTLEQQIAQRPLTLDAGQGSALEPVELSDEEEEDDTDKVMSVPGEVRADYWFVQINEIDVDIGPTERRRCLKVKEDDEKFAYEESLFKEYSVLDPPS
jgi:hypothetical protein